ncbi:MAG: hypothetical protein IZT56_13495 [Bacteroidetes bacterium]|nr:hypothetical protein [Bacteroidota bacterium]
MKRVIVDYQKLNEDILNLLVAKFPDGYDDDNIISFRNAKNEVVEAIEVKIADTIYLVKVGVRLVKAMEDFNDEDSDDETTEVNFEEVKEEDLNYNLD